MLKVQEVVNFVNKKFNELGTESGYSFDIHAEVGESQNNGKINGILYTNQASTTPIPDYTENNYSFVCELLVPSARANYHFEQIEGIVENFIKEIDGTKIEFAEGEGLLNITPSKPENFNVGYNAGENVPLYFTINVVYTEGAITSGDVHWLLNGMEIPFLNDDIIVDKEGNVNKIYGKYNTQVFLTSQTRYYRFRFPFKRKTTGDFYGLCESLQNDLLTGNFDKQYTLTFYDGTAYTEDAPFETTVSIFKSGNASGQRGKVKIFDITFAEVDKTTNADDVKYSIALIDNPFDNQTENTRWFESQLDQQAWFNTKISSGARYERIKAPNLNSIDITSQIYPNNAGYDVFDLANKNYAIIKYEKGSGVTKVTKYFYYFVTNCQIGSNNQVLYDLKLDTIQTYYFDSNIQFSDCYIERSNLNRFVDVDGDDTKVAFDGGVDSKLFEREETQGAAKRLTKRTRLGTTNFFPDEAVNKWFEDNVEAWMYAYLDSSHTFNTYNVPTSSADSQLSNSPITFDGDYSLNIIDKSGARFNTKLLCVCVPILKGNGRLIIKFKSGNDEWTALSFGNGLNFDKFLNGNKGAADEENENRQDAYVLAKKISNVAPESAFYLSRYFSYSINALQPEILTITYDISNGVPVMYNQDKDTQNFGMLLVRNQQADYETNSYELADKLTFTKAEIVGTELSPTTKNPKFNPKLLSTEYKTLKICNQGEEGFDYDAQKLNKQTFSLIVSEPLSPDITKEYIRIKNPSGIYIADTQNNLTGLVSSNDTSLVLITDQFQSMLANQKNYFQQNALNRQEQYIAGTIGGGTGILGGLITGNPFGVIGGVTSLVETQLRNINAKKQEAYTVDNMKNAPASIQNAKGNVFLNAMSTGFGIFVEEYDILPHEKNIVNDFMVQYGFTTNQIGQIKDYIGDTTSGHKNSRRYFNYIQAQLNSISGIPMSNVARADMRQRFAEGVRFWKQDNVDYTYENYENWLAE